MKWYRYLLIPFGLLYGSGAWLRRWWFSRPSGRRRKAALKTIVVGNLQVGGAGKTPMTIWLAGQLEHQKKLAVLSRGYGRKTRGFREVISTDSTSDTGDEPMEIRHSLPPDQKVFVGEDRHAGLSQITAIDQTVNLALLDDAYQHLPLQADASLLLTTWNHPFTRDWPMPAGNLREFANAAQYCTCIVVTKCPEQLQTSDALGMYQELMHFGKPIFFCRYQLVVDGAENAKGKGFLVSGLAGNQQFFDQVSGQFQIGFHRYYPDHYQFVDSDYNQWKMDINARGCTYIICSRKDRMRMPQHVDFGVPLLVAYTVPEFHFGGDDALIELLLNEIS